MANALAAIAAAQHAGVAPTIAIEALSCFRGVKRRMELYGTVNGIAVYDDFAHHPTAIRTSLDGLRAHLTGGRILAILEPRSNTMRLGAHGEQLAPALDNADQVYIYTPAGLSWDIAATLSSLKERLNTRNQVAAIIQDVVSAARPGDCILIMSNGGFEGIHQRLLDALAQ
jgi:UDP-N-acetylmuramate: L-alanyl-gamma-D-glutamyl-meso-diaminopimelate ligase